MIGSDCLDPSFNSETLADLKQIKGLVHERNDYRMLLEKCLLVFNALPNLKIDEVRVKSTYELTLEIEDMFREYDSQ